MLSSPAAVAEGQLSLNESLQNYSRSLHEYTLRLWTESRRKVEQQAQARAKAQNSGPAARRSDRHSK